MPLVFLHQTCDQFRCASSLRPTNGHGGRLAPAPSAFGGLQRLPGRQRPVARCGALGHGGGVEKGKNGFGQLQIRRGAPKTDGPINYDYESYRNTLRIWDVDGIPKGGWGMDPETFHLSSVFTNVHAFPTPRRFSH